MQDRQENQRWDSQQFILQNEFYEEDSFDGDGQHYSRTVV